MVLSQLKEGISGGVRVKNSRSQKRAANKFTKQQVAQHKPLPAKAVVPSSETRDDARNACNRNNDKSVADNETKTQSRTVEDIETEIPLGAAAASAESCSVVGNRVTFGTYMRGESDKKKSPIEWIVLEVQENKALLISRYGIECKPYDKFSGGVTWEECSLREWLNNTFVKRAFATAEQMAILTSTVDNSESQGFDFTGNRWAEKTTGGCNTQDKIFLLSYAEANKYFDVRANNHSNKKSRVQPTVYAIRSGAHQDDRYKTSDGNGAGWWWLRSPGYKQAYALYVSCDGALDGTGGREVDDSYGSVRPAFWINLEWLKNAGNQLSDAEGYEGGSGYGGIGQTNEAEPSPAVAASKESCIAGRYVTFGTYPQTEAGDDNTHIEWLVLDVQDNKALLISRYLLDRWWMYNLSDAADDCTWEKSYMRKALNNGFRNYAFSAAEQKAILTTIVDNNKSQGFSRWKINGGNNTQDKIFLLSYAEASKYFGVTSSDDDNTKSRAAPTDYAFFKESGRGKEYYTKPHKHFEVEHTDDGEDVFVLTEGMEEDLYQLSKAGRSWWLRSPGSSYKGSACIRRDGSLDHVLNSYNMFVRPAMWIDLDSISESVPDKPTDAVSASRESCAVAGNHVTFGAYPQTKAGTDNTPVEWLVLEVQDNKALLISRYGLDVKPYHNAHNEDSSLGYSYLSTTWEKCTLRTWLNDTFLNEAFSSEEQKAMLTTMTDNSESQCFDFTLVNEYAEKTTGGNNTQDKIFLLSYAEANKYFGVTCFDYDNIKARVQPTEYAIKSGAKGRYSQYWTADGNVTWHWWLRSPGCCQYYAACVENSGSLISDSVRGSDWVGRECVRPAFWIDLESEILR